PNLRVAVQGQAAQQVVEAAAELGVQAQDPDNEVPPVLALLGQGGLPAANLTAVDVEPGVDVERMVRAGDVDAAVVGDRLDHLRVLGAEAVPDEIAVLVRAAGTQLQVAQAAAEAGLSGEQVAALTRPAQPEVELLE